MMIAKTGKEARFYGLSRYFTGLPCKYGHFAERYAKSGHCIACDNKRIKNTELRAKSIKSYYEKNKQKCFKRVKLQKQKNVGSAYRYVKTSRAKYPSKINALNAKRHASKLNRTPKWLNNGHLFEIDCIYKYCQSLNSVGLDYHVDHIVPLQGNSVSGFHVPWNLQVIPAKINISKGNKFVDL